MGPGPYNPTEFAAPPELVFWMLGAIGVALALGGILVAVDALRKKRKRS